MSAPHTSAAAAATTAAVSAVAPGVDAEHARPPARHAYSRLCGLLSKICLVLAIFCLIGIILSVQIQVVGRYVFNDTPTWAEALALQLVLYVTALGVAVGVRDAGHIGLESLVSLLPEALRLKLEILIHMLVALFGGIMVQSGMLWTRLKWDELDPMLHLPVGIDYLSLVIAGVLIVMFSIEHIVALLRNEEVVPSWY
ncbi:TRAP-type C4-dicarboxylate transport system, small permease component [Rhodoferax sp. OV413]|uniref:TRAP transporter small permease n=1 Tax=Rhodoferax sp. OV413 TaxID=1855285 RepID=UPI0008913DA1|nr:TRAP transporter small permease [Rhodoferax sp. OV413]SDP35633.1 TRAP-type C4-dicarboxylate transport system, small permease component [Rhodoferax sp. OV413]